MRNTIIRVPAWLLLLTLLCLLCQGAPAASPPPPPGDDDIRDSFEEPGAPFKAYIPTHPQVKKLHLQAMALAEEFAAVQAQRAALLPESALLEKEEAALRHQLLKYRLEYYRQRDLLAGEAGDRPQVIKALKDHDGRMEDIEELVMREEKIDCYHTIFERKHKAMEEYHWSLIDGKHPLIREYLKGLDWERHGEEFGTLYGEMIADYRRMIDENRLIIKETKEITGGRKERAAILRSAVKEMKALAEDPVFERTAPKPRK
jgi:hypothetical protein